MRVIDLLNKIANGKTPPKIKFKNTTKPIFEYNTRNGKYEYCYKSNKGKNEICELTFLNLNDEIEIIEEDKQIEKLNTWFSCESSYLDSRQYIDLNAKQYFEKINEIIDYLKYKEEESNK